MKKILWVLLELMLVSNTTFAMTFSQPIEVGKIDVPLQRGGWGINISGAVNNTGNYYRKFIKESNGYNKGIAQFGNGTNALYFHYDYGTVFESKSSLNPQKYFRLGSKDISNTVGIFLGNWGSVLQIQTDSGMTFYSIRFEYCTSDLTLIGKNKNGKWIKYIYSKDVSKKYFGGKDGYKEDGGIIYNQPVTRGEYIIIPYCRWYWEGKSNPEGEFRLKWDEAAQWFGIEHVVY